MARLNSTDFTPIGLTDNFMGNTLLCDCPFYLFFILNGQFLSLENMGAPLYGHVSGKTTTLRHVLLSKGNLKSTVNAMDNQKIERRPLQLNQTVEATVGKVIIDRCYNFDLLHLGPRDYSLPSLNESRMD